MTTASLIRPDRSTSSDTRCCRARAGGAASSASDRLGGSRAGQIVTGGPAARYQRSHRPAVPLGRSERGHAPNYVARRIVAALVALGAVVGVVSVSGSLVAGFGGAPAAAAEAPPLQAGVTRQAPAHHVAQPGDTLWSIASTYRGTVEQGRYVDALIRLNGGTSIEVGQAVRLP